jgi:hypothetical protein
MQLQRSAIMGAYRAHRVAKSDGCPASAGVKCWESKKVHNARINLPWAA